MVIGVPADRTDAFADDLEKIGLTARPSNWRRSTMACTGIEFCKLAIVETKAQAARVVDELERRLGALDSPITVHINGCPNSCARIQVADIGLKGQIVVGPDGDQVEGFQVHLGGHFGANAAFGRKFRGLKVSADGMPDYIERILRGYLDRREPDERFAGYVARAEEAWLQ